MIGFSVIVPVYQAEKYLEECLESLLKQSYLNFEVIMVDDGSKDNSYLICYRFQQKDKRFFTVRQENKGVSSARNRGLAVATKEYVLFVDADDYISCDYLKHFAQILTGEEDICFSTKYYEVIHDKVELVEERPYKICYKWKKQQEIFSEFSKGKWIPPFAVMNNCYRREFLLKYNICFNPAFLRSEDMDFVFQAYLVFQKGAWLEEPGYFYRKDNENSATYKISMQGLKSVLMVYEKWYHFCIRKKGQAYKNWAEYFSKMGNTYLVLGGQLRRAERKQIFRKSKKSQEFYFGNSNMIKRIIVIFYNVFGYERIVPIVAFLSKVKIILRKVCNITKK